MITSYTILEERGIVGMYKDEKGLHIITKGGSVWLYDPKEKGFSYEYSFYD